MRSSSHTHACAHAHIHTHTHTHVLSLFFLRLVNYFSHVHTSTAYEVKVFTADKKYAGTNNNLHLIIVDDKSSSKNFKMKNSSRDPKLQRGQTDSFNVATSNLLGDVKGIKIAHCARHAPKSSMEQGRQRKGSNSEMDEKWYLFQVFFFTEWEENLNFTTRRTCLVLKSTKQYLYQFLFQLLSTPPE